MDLILEQRQRCVLSPSKVWENLNFSTEILSVQKIFLLYFRDYVPEHEIVSQICNTNAIFCIHDLGKKNGCRPVYMAVMQQKIEIDAILLGILKNRLFTSTQTRFIYCG